MGARPVGRADADAVVLFIDAAVASFSSSCCCCCCCCCRLVDPMVPVEFGEKVVVALLLPADRRGGSTLCFGASTPPPPPECALRIFFCGEYCASIAAAVAGTRCGGGVAAAALRFARDMLMAAM